MLHLAHQGSSKEGRGLADRDLPAGPWLARVRLRMSDSRKASRAQRKEVPWKVSHSSSLPLR